MPKLIDTFLFSEAFEKELLLLKLIHEDPIVDLFIALESAYTFRGQHKGCQLAKLLVDDSRFHPFVHKIKYVSIEENRCRSQNENMYCWVSDTQRGFAQDFIFSNFNDSDFVIISDVDEFIDGTNKQRKNRLAELLAANQPLSIERLRYWWDFDNIGSFDQGEICLPIYPIWAFKNGSVRWQDRKWKGQFIPHNNLDYLVFEYSSCFDWNGIWRKHDTFAHDRFTEQDLRVALDCNHWAMRNGAKIDNNNPHLWFETVELHEGIAPKYIVDNLSKLKNYVVNPNYKVRRKEVYNKV